MEITNVQEAKTHLLRLMAEVQAGKEVVIGKAGKPIAKLVPIEHDASERICIIFSLYCDPWYYSARRSYN